MPLLLRNVEGVAASRLLASIVLGADGTVRAGTLNGTWVPADRSQRLYRVTWPKLQDEVTLSDDASRLQDGNQYGASVSGERLQDCR